MILGLILINFLLLGGWHLIYFCSILKLSLINIINELFMSETYTIFEMVLVFSFLASLSIYILISNHLESKKLKQNPHQSCPTCGQSVAIAQEQHHGPIHPNQPAHHHGSHMATMTMDHHNGINHIYSSPIGPANVSDLRNPMNPVNPINPHGINNPASPNYIMNHHH